MPKITRNVTERSFVAETGSALVNTSFLLPVITYPVKECYTSWIKTIQNEYQIRSLIRAITITGSFVAGPILIEMGNFGWLYDRSYGLYSGFPVFNQLPETAGVIIASSFIFSYFCAWTIVHASNIFNHFRFDGAEHYLTPDKNQQILDVITKNNFKISLHDVENIFNKINLQLRHNPTNRDLEILINKFRKGDLQSVLDQTDILKHKIALAETKINLLSSNQLYQEITSPQGSPIITSELLPPLNNSGSFPAAYNTTEELELAQQPSPSSRIPIEISSIVNPSFEIIPDLSHNPLRREAVIYQYHKQDNKFSSLCKGLFKQKHKDKDPTNIALEQLQQEKKKLEDQMFIAPGNIFC